MPHPLEHCILKSPTRWHGCVKIEMVPGPGVIEKLSRIPGVFYFDNPKYPADHGWYGPKNLLRMGQRGAVLEDYAPDYHGATPSGMPLLDHQLRSVSFLRDMDLGDEGKLLGADAGLGKTTTTLQALWLDGLLEKRGLIVGPLKSISSWVGELADPAKHFSMTIQPLEGTGAPDISILQRHRFFYIHYEIVRTWQAWLFQVLQPAWIIFDESHQCINKSTYSEAAYHLSCIDSLERRYLLSGTPNPKLRYHMFWQLAIAQPRQWGDRPHKFGVAYCAGEQRSEEEGGYWTYDGESNSTEFRARLAGVFLKYTTQQIEDQMPPPKRTVISVQMTQEQLAEYKEAELYPIRYLRSKGLTKKGGTFQIGDVVVKLTERDVKPQAMRIRCMTLLINILAAIKRQHALTAISEFWSRHDKIVVFTWRRESARWISDKMREAITVWKMENLYTVFGPIHGEMPHVKRLEKANEFAREPRKSLFVATRGACGMSMNELRFASSLINVSLDYTTTNITQGDARVFRMGNPHLGKLELGYLKVDNTIDEHILDIMDRKAHAAVGISERDVDGLRLVQDLRPSLNDGASTIETLCNLLGLFKDIEEGEHL